MAKLTAKQQRFVEEYLIDLNATQAAIRAGYSPNTAEVIGFENLRKPKVKTYIDEHLEEIRTEKTADAQEVLEYLTSVMRNELTEEVVVVEGDGDGCSSARRIEKDTAIKDRVKAAELLGKRYSLFTDKVDMTTDMDLNITIDYGDEDES